MIAIRKGRKRLGLCACGNKAAGWSNGSPVCNRCNDIESSVTDMTQGMVERRAKRWPANDCTLAMFNKCFSDWCERRGIDYERECKYGKKFSSKFNTEDA